MVWYGMTWLGMAWYGLVWFGLVWFGLVYRSIFYLFQSQISIIGKLTLLCTLLHHQADTSLRHFLCHFAMFLKWKYGKVQADMYF